MEKIILGDIERQIKNKEIIRHNRHELIKEKPYVINLFFYFKVTDLMGEGKMVYAILLDFNKALDTILHSILLEKLSNS